VTCVSRNTTCAYAALSPDLSRARARYHHEDSNHASNLSANGPPTQTNAFAPHTNERMREGFNRSPTTTLSPTQRRESTANNANALPTAGTSRELPGNTAPENHDRYGFAAASGSGWQGGQKQAEDANGDSDPAVTISRGRSGERLNEQSRLLNDGKGRLCKFGPYAGWLALQKIWSAISATVSFSPYNTDVSQCTSATQRRCHFSTPSGVWWKVPWDPLISPKIHIGIN
jgi:hypothetical protein